ncbi:MAG: hypothetical protein FJZ05_01055, partial [Candidatus Nealsonbacteria bacterium]|nr:hypothetical protein [Candidatus Nealsonbacteria bacterium]
MDKSSSQQFLEIDQIKEGFLLLKNRSLRGVLMVSSLNFALKSDDEQKAIIYQFQNFLNGLDFSIEIVLQSRILNITGYIDKLEEMERLQDNELMKIQTAEYRKFITELVGGRQILSKIFFLTVPFTLVEIPQLVGKKKPADFNEDHFQRAKSQLWQRMEFVAVGLRRCGLQCSPLNTLELIELFWSLHHPDESEVGYYPDIPP